MNVNIRVAILGGFVFILLVTMFFRSCSKPPQKGAQVYEKKCADCHGANGEGFRNLIPPLNNADFLDQHTDDFACIVAYGIDDTIVVNGVTFHQPMAGIPELNEVEIANVANYVYEQWSTSKKKFSPKEVETRIANCE